jgi:hypothetical protein
MNNSLSIVVLTQNNRCNIIPKINKTINTNKNDFLIKKEIINAAIIVIITSAIASPINRYEWIPLPGSPRASLYLHNKLI